MFDSVSEAVLATFNTFISITAVTFIDGYMCLYVYDIDGNNDIWIIRG
jgi:hypothetical protein